MTRVLVVEDEDSFSDAISYLLRKEGFEVAVRSNVSSASGPVAQTATSKPSLRSRYEIASLNESSSSTTSTRVTDSSRN